MSAAEGRLHARGRVELGDYPVDAAWSPDGQWLVIGGGEGALLRLAVARGEVSAIGRHEGGVLALAWQKAGALFASSGQDGGVRLWDARSFTGREIHRAPHWSEGLAFADSGRLLAVASGRELRVFDAQGELRHSLAGHSGPIAAIAWRPQSTEIAAAGNGGVRLHRLEPQPQWRDHECRGACRLASWKADGRVLAAGLQDGSVQLWYFAAGSQSQIGGFGTKVLATEWSASGRYLATAANATVVVWDFAGRGPEGSRPLELDAHSERISALAFRPIRGSSLVSAALDRRLLLWRVGSSSSPQDAHLLPEECTWLRFSRDGARLAVGDARGGVSLFDCAP